MGFVLIEESGNCSDDYTAIVVEFSEDKAFLQKKATEYIIPKLKKSKSNEIIHGFKMR